MRYLLHICAFVIDGIRFRLVLCMYTVLWFLSFFVSPASAQPVPLPLNPKTEEYFFEEVKLPGGTPIRDVIALQEDRQGFIWLASKHGLFRYDGHDFKIFRHTPGDDKSIVDTELWSLYMLGDSLLCVGTTHGVSLIDIRTDHITNLPNDTEGNPVGYVSCFYQDEAGILWIGGLEGLYSMRPDLSGIVNHHLLSMTKEKSHFGNRVYDIVSHTMDSNRLMLATFAGLVSFNKKKNAFHQFHPNTQATFRHSQPGVYKFVKEGNYLWVLSWISGMPRFDMATEQWENLAYPKPGDRLETTSNVWAVSDFMEKNANELWICDWDRGLFIFDKNEQQLKPLEGRSNCEALKNPRMSIFMQRDSTLWLANYDGLWRQNRKKNRFRRVNIPCSHTWIMPVWHDETTENYYFGMVHQSYGIADWSARTHSWHFLQTETDRREELSTYDIFKDHRGVLWVGTYRRGLWYVDQESRQLKRFLLPDGKQPEAIGRTIYKIFEDSRHNLWIGTGRRGIACINAQRNNLRSFLHVPGDSTSLIDGTHFRAIAEDSYGRIWIGNHRGFCTFDPPTGTFSQEIPCKLYATGIKPGETYSIVTDTTGTMWMTIVGQGLVRIRENQQGTFRFRTYQTDDGLKDLSVRYMTKDREGNLWIVNNGLLYFNPYDESFMLTDTQNGLIENLGGDDRINIDGYGNVFAGNQVGTGWTKEAQSLARSNVVNLLIEHVLVNGESFDWKMEDKVPLRLSSMDDQHNLTFRYTAVCFNEYEQVRYRYRLEGLESEWNPPTKNLEARYTNLPPGKYRFIVDVAYKGNWLGYNRTVRFEIRQAFWETPWFIAMLLLAVATIIAAIYLNRRRHLEKQRRIRLKIASDLHDDIGSTLSSISIMSSLLQAQHPEDDSCSYTRDMLHEIGTNAQNMLESMDDIIWSVLPANDEFRTLILRLREYAIPLFESKDIRFSITAPEALYSQTIVMDKRRNIFLIAKEAVNNLMKYSECTEALIEFAFSRSVLRLVISDNGKGFDPSKKYDRSGLPNMKFRAEKIGGKLSIRSEAGKGTSIKLTVKIT